ncbi:MAG TPA: helix-turn-helix transcriptional regulator [Chitinophagaceae bacterium]|nr:helix-turn-helix transcriptional regulator [Chitinophagaceae bacterium]
MAQPLRVQDKSEPGKLLKVARFKNEIRRTAPHKHNNYFELIYLSAGSGTHYIDQEPHAVEPPLLFFIRQEQVHHWDLDSPPEGYVLLLKKGFLEKSLDRELQDLLSRVGNLARLPLTETLTMDQLFDLLTRECAVSSEMPGQFAIQEGLLKALLGKILALGQPALVSQRRKRDLYGSFRDLLERPGILRNSVAHYAALLNTTPQNLSNACRQAVRQSATEVLADQIIGEAKRLLIYTDKTVSEISFSLDFHDPSHFVKYFKRYTGATPQAFRHR